MSKSVVWRVAEPPPDGFRLDLASFGGPSGPLPARLLYNRGITNDRQAREFLNPDLSGLSSPFDLPDMDTASSRLLSAAAAGERIGVFGDFDVDGLTGTAILVDAITRLGGDALPYIPHREKEGHGLSIDAVRYFRNAGAGLIVTVDTGTDAVGEVDAAARVGIDTIITDHHVATDTLPTAVAIVNPDLSNSPVGELTGAGVAFMLGRAIFELAGSEQPAFHTVLAALGTIADRGPLRDDNRRIAKAGLAELGRTGHAGLQALKAISGPSDKWSNPTSESVAFQLAPRLNAPGRLDDATPSLTLLTTEDPERARELAGYLDSCNRERRKLGDELLRMATAQIADQTERNAIAAVTFQEVAAGLLGPLAGRLCESMGKPAIAVSVADGVARGSARSIPEFDIQSALKASESLLTKFGGHARAAGFTTPASSLDQVLDAVNGLAEWAMMGVEPQPELSVDYETSFEGLTASTWEFMRVLGPFGEGNPEPVIVSRRLNAFNVRTVGAGGQHLRVDLESGGYSIPAIGFRLGGAPLGNGIVDIAYTPTENVWRGRRTRELSLLDIRPSSRSGA